MLYEAGENPSEFERMVNTHDKVVVVFYADWCGFCGRFCPEVRDVAKGSGSDFVMVNISDEENPLWDKYRIDVVPTIMLFSRGSVVDRKSGRLERKDLLEFMRRHQVE